MYGWVLNTSLEGFAQDAPQEELAITPVAECLTTTTKSITNKFAVSRPLTIFLKIEFLLTFF